MVPGVGRFPSEPSEERSRSVYFGSSNARVNSSIRHRS
jgi:hypothetical protein